MLRRNKYNIYPDPEKCKDCSFCCCSANIPVQAYDLDIDWNNMEEELNRLFETGMFYSYGKGMNTRLVKYNFDEYRCIFWTMEGCRLSADTRPQACRYFGPTEKVDYCMRHSIRKKEMRKPFSLWGSVIYVDCLEDLKKRYDKSEMFLKEYNTIDFDEVLKTLNVYDEPVVLEKPILY